jgi:methyl-accepting chemotaxis protein
MSDAKPFVSDREKLRTQLQARKEMFLITDQARASAAVSAAKVGKVLPGIFAEHADRFRNHSTFRNRDLTFLDSLVDQEIHHFQLLFEEGFDERYIERLEALCEAERPLGVGPRFRLALSINLTSAALRQATAGIPGFGPRIFRSVDSIMRLAFIDTLNTISLEQDRERFELEKRRATLDAVTSELLETVSGLAGNAAGLSEQLTSASTIVAKASAAVQEQAEEVHIELSGVTEQIGATATSASKVSSSVADVSALSRESLLAVQKTIMDSRKSKDEIQRLTSLIADIQSVAGIISGIASQTNLLALNATIEAARAGESGRGFAVVANEVKALAAQTEDATASIKQRIEEVSQAMTAAMRALDGTFEQIGALEKVGDQLSSANADQLSVAHMIVDEMNVLNGRSKAIDMSVDAIITLVRASQADVQNLRSIALASSSENTRAMQTISGLVDKIRAA